MDNAHIQRYRDGYAIYYPSLNRYYCIIGKNNVYQPVSYNTKDEAIKQCESMGDKVAHITKY